MDAQGERQELADALDRFTGKVDQLLSSGSVNTNTVNNSAGAAGIWVCATACLVMLTGMGVGSVVGGLWLVREFNRIDIELSERKEENDRAQTYLSSIFGRVPELRQKIDKEQEKEKASAK